jgi:hypothetical protein
MKANWTVVVIYASAEARELAVDFCDRLVKRFWTRCGFDVSWWSFELLHDGIASHEAANRTASADLLVFSRGAQVTMPDHVLLWMESWLSLRGAREGVLVSVPPGPAPAAEPIDHQLRKLAHRAGMDYLTEVPQNLGLAVEESPDFYSARAQEVTHVLSDILRRPPPTPLL